MTASSSPRYDELSCLVYCYKREPVRLVQHTEEFPSAQIIELSGLGRIKHVLFGQRWLFHSVLPPSAVFRQLMIYSSHLLRMIRYLFPWNIADRIQMTTSIPTSKKEPVSRFLLG